MSNYQKLNEEQKEDLKEVFKGMKLSKKESEVINGGEAGALICLTSICNWSCNTRCYQCIASFAYSWPVDDIK
jgi:hypothetical protein